MDSEQEFDKMSKFEVSDEGSSESIITKVIKKVRDKKHIILFGLRVLGRPSGLTTQ